MVNYHSFWHQRPITISLKPLNQTDSTFEESENQKNHSNKCDVLKEVS